MDAIISISKQLSPRFSSGCILCGNGVTWRAKILDPQNRPMEICVDCLLMQKKIKPREVEDVREENSDEGRVRPAEEKKGRAGRPKPKDTGKEQATGSKPKADVGRQEVQPDKDV